MWRRVTHSHHRYDLRARGELCCPGGNPAVRVGWPREGSDGREVGTFEVVVGVEGGRSGLQSFGSIGLHDRSAVVKGGEGGRRGRFP